jgi:hypothetical protein
MSARWLIAGAMLLFAVAAAIALFVSVVRDVEADRIDSGGRRRGKRKRRRIDLFEDEEPKP